jgi:hypothetical protein
MATSVPTSPVKLRLKPLRRGASTSALVGLRRSFTGSLNCGDPKEVEAVTLTFASWNRIREWLRRLDALRRVA